jgi:hypothetical protein
MVVDPGVHYQGPLPSPILKVHGLHKYIYTYINVVIFLCLKVVAINRMLLFV